jgi:hypothetical protein
MMAFVRHKPIRGRSYYQLVENTRVDDRVRQRVLVHLGRYASVGTALDAWPDEIAHWEWLADAARAEAARQQALYPGRAYQVLLQGGTYNDGREFTFWLQRPDVYERRATNLQTQLDRLRAWVATQECSA